MGYFPTMTPIGLWNTWLGFTGSIPEMYWNIDSDEQRYKLICKRIQKLVEYAQYLGVSFNEMVDTLNEMTALLPQYVDEATAKEIARLVESGEFAEMVQEAIIALDARLKEYPFFDATQYGVANDGTDCYQALQALLLQVHNSGGGIVYLKPGNYNTSNTLYIGDNTTLMGAGAATKLYTENSGGNARFMGVVALVSGSNSGIENLWGTYDNPNRIFRYPGSNFGFTAVSNYTIESGIAFSTAATMDTDLLEVEAHTNMWMRDIYCDASYATQVEPNAKEGSATAISSIDISNIVCPNGVISISSPEAGMMHDVSMHDCVCAFARTSGGHAEKNISVTNIQCEMARLLLWDTVISNVVVDFKLTGTVATWLDSVTNQFESNSLFYSRSGICSDVRVHANGADICGATIITADNAYPVTANNVTVNGVESDTNYSARLGAGATALIANINTVNNNSIGTAITNREAHGLQLDKLISPNQNLQIPQLLSEQNLCPILMSAAGSNWAPVSGSLLGNTLASTGCCINDGVAFINALLANSDPTTPVENGALIFTITTAEAIPDKVIRFPIMGIANDNSTPVTMVGTIDTDGKCTIAGAKFPTSVIGRIAVQVHYPVCKLPVYSELPTP